jgi:hypothetical protein
MSKLTLCILRIKSILPFYALQGNKNQLFIYNINQISEKDIYEILNLAVSLDSGLGNILESSDYPIIMDYSF